MATYNYYLSYIAESVRHVHAWIMLHVRNYYNKIILHQLYIGGPLYYYAILIGVLPSVSAATHTSGEPQTSGTLYVIMYCNNVIPCMHVPIMHINLW